MSHSIEQLNVSRDNQLQVVFPAKASLACLWSRTNKLKEITDVLYAAGLWSGMEYEPDSRGICIARNGATLGLLHWNGRLDLSCWREVAEQLVAEEMASRDPQQPDTGGVVFDVRTSADVDRALWLLRLAYLTLNL
jgi:hypothetical protein